MPPALSQALRDQIEDYFLRCDDTSFIREAIGVSLSQISKMRKFWEEIGLVTPAQGLRSPSRLITPRMGEDLLEWLEQRPLTYLDEITYFLFDEYDIIISKPTISKFLKRVR